MNQLMKRPDTPADALSLAETLCKSGLAPKGLERPEAMVAAVILWAEKGIPMVAGMNGTYVVNGRPTLFGTVVLGLVQGSPNFSNEHFAEGYEGTGKDLVAWCQMARQGGHPIRKEYGFKDADYAGISGNATWKKHPKEMMMWRARHRVMQACFADVLAGLDIKEVMETAHVEPMTVSEPRRAPMEFPGVKHTVAELPVPSVRTQKEVMRDRAQAVEIDDAEWMGIMEAATDENGITDLDLIEAEIKEREANV